MPEQAAFSEDISYEKGGAPETLVKAIELNKRGESAPEPSELPFVRLGENFSYKEVRAKILSLIQKEAPHIYHNRAHTEDVEARFLELATHTTLSEVSRAWGGLRALLHDFGHSGTTERSRAVSVTRPDLTNEEFAALRIHTLFEKYLTQEEITYLQTGVLATTFGPRSDTYGPRNDSEKLLALADIGGFVNDFDAWMSESLDVLEESRPTLDPSADVREEYKKYVTISRLGFLKFCEARLMPTEHIFTDKEYFKNLRQHLNNKRTSLEGEASAPSEKYLQRFAQIHRR